MIVDSQQKMSHDIMNERRAELFAFGACWAETIEPRAYIIPRPTVIEASMLSGLVIPLKIGPATKAIDKKQAQTCHENGSTSPSQCWSASGLGTAKHPRS